jgi:hypothetical protein
MRWGALALVFAACGDSSGPAGQCGKAQTPMPLVSGVAPVALALQGGTLFFTTQKPGSNQFSVMRVAAAGGTPEMIAQETGATTGGGLCVDANAAYFARGSDLVAWKNGAESTLTTVSGDVQGCASDGANVYLIANTVRTGGTSGLLARVPAGGGSMEALASLVAPSVMTLDGQTVFVGTIGSHGAGKVQRIAGGAMMDISTATFVEGIGTDATDVYWTDAESGSAGSVKHAPKAGGPVTTVAVSQTGYPQGVALDGPYLYWTNPGERAAYSQIGSDQPVAIATTDGTPGAIVSAGCTVYVGVAGAMSPDQGSILRIDAK